MTLDLTAIVRLIGTYPLELLAIALSVPVLVFIDQCYAEDDNDAPFEA